MPTKRQRRARSSGLSKSGWAALQVGTGMNCWSDGEREYYRELWQKHGRRLIEEAKANKGPMPMAELEFGAPQPEE